MSNSFFVFLPSNVTDYPENQPNKFRVRLPKPLHFNGAWVCGLHSISYPYSWSTIGTLDEQWIDIHFTDRNAPDEDKQRVIRVPVPKAAHNTAEQLKEFLTVTLRNHSGAKLLPLPREVEQDRNRTKPLESQPPLKRDKRDAGTITPPPPPQPPPILDEHGKPLGSPPKYKEGEENVIDSPPLYQEKQQDGVTTPVGSKEPSPVPPTQNSAKPVTTTTPIPPTSKPPPSSPQSTASVKPPITPNPSTPSASAASAAAVNPTSSTPVNTTAPVVAAKSSTPIKPPVQTPTTPKTAASAASVEQTTSAPPPNSQPKDKSTVKKSATTPPSSSTTPQTTPKQTGSPTKSEQDDAKQSSGPVAAALVSGPPATSSHNRPIVGVTRVINTLDPPRIYFRTPPANADPRAYIPISVLIFYLDDLEKFKVVFNEEIISHLSFSPQLGYVLGFENPQHVVSNEVAKYGCDLRGGISSFAVYSKGLTENIIIGNTLSSLLRVVSISGAIPGDYTEKIYDSPIFARVLPREINEIEIELRTMDRGRLVPFAYGTTMVVLIFKKVINF